MDGSPKSRRAFRLRVVDVALAAVAVLGFFWMPGATLRGKVMLGTFATACVLGIMLRWGWLLPSTCGTFLLLLIFQPFLRGYSHGPEESLQHEFVIPAICAAVVAAMQVGSFVISKTFLRGEASDDRNE